MKPLGNQAMTGQVEQTGVQSPGLDDSQKQDVFHLEHQPTDRIGNDKTTNVGEAVLEQKNVIPTTGKRIPTSKWEYITFCIFVSIVSALVWNYGLMTSQYFSLNGARESRCIILLGVH
jgi:hypothetical protein